MTTIRQGGICAFPNNLVHLLIDRCLHSNGNSNYKRHTLVRLIEAIGT